MNIELYVKQSTAMSGVPLTVEEEQALLAVAKLIAHS
jgi:hypothetical protein